MKAKNLFFVLVLAFGLLSVTSVFAINETAVSAGATVTYTVTNGDGAWGGGQTYAWDVLQSDQSTPATSSDYTATFGTTNSNDITWNLAGTYFIRIIATDASGCLSDPFDTEITVTNAVLCIADGSTAIDGSTPAAPDVTETCSLIAAGSGNGTGATGGDVTTFYATITGAVPNRTYTVTYTVGSSAGTSTASITTGATGEGSVAIAVTSTDYPGEFTNATGSDATVTIAVATMSDGSWTSDASNLCASPSYDVTVHTTPTMSF